MNYVINKEQYDKVVFKLLYSLFGKLTTHKSDNSDYIEIYDIHDNNFCDLWLGGSVKNKGCKNDLQLNFSEAYDIYKFFPLVKKKRFAKLFALYVEKNTGLKVDCVSYSTNFKEEKDADGDDNLDYQHLTYSIRKKKFIK